MKLRNPLTITNLFWLIYIALLGVLLPHTAWAFNHFQETISKTDILGISWMAWALALVFEGAVFAFTHRVKERIEKGHRLRPKDGEMWLMFCWRRFSLGYLTIFSFGLLLSSSVSAFANFAYSVEFSQPFVVYGEYSFPPLLYEIAFGGILPVVSFLFARILAEAVDTENERDDALVSAQKGERIAKRETAEVREKLVEAQNEFDTNLERLRLEFEQAKARFAQYERLMGIEKRERILAARELWPTLQPAGIAAIADASPGYVSDILHNGKEG